MEEHHLARQPRGHEGKGGRSSEGEDRVDLGHGEPTAGADEADLSRLLADANSPFRSLPDGGRLRLLPAAPAA